MNTPIQLQEEGADLLVIGFKIYHQYFGPACLDFPVGSDMVGHAKHWLEEIGFERVEVVQGDLDDVLLFLLWWNVEGRSRQGIIEFAGHDSGIISAFTFAGEWIA